MLKNQEKYCLDLMPKNGSFTLFEIFDNCLDMVINMSEFPTMCSDLF